MKKWSPRGDLNPQSFPPEGNALSIRPQGLTDPCFVISFKVYSKGEKRTFCENEVSFEWGVCEVPSPFIKSPSQKDGVHANESRQLLQIPLIIITPLVRSRGTWRDGFVHHPHTGMGFIHYILPISIC